MNRLLLLLFFLSGFSALIYEVVWARQLSLIFGTTTASVSSILAIFFLGLAIGSWLFGRLVDHHSNGKRMSPLLLYGLLEAGIGGYALLTPLIFKIIENGGWNVLLSSFAGLIIPTIFMGATFPVIMKTVNARERIGKEIGVLYGANTLGAALGAFMAGFVLIASFGVKETIFIAAGINLLIGVLAARMNANKERMNTNPSTGSMSSLQASSGQRERMGYLHISSDSLKDKGRIRLNSLAILTALFFTGFSALALEVLWTRVLIMFFGASVYAFAVVLVSFLLGIALGSLIYSRIKANLTEAAFGIGAIGLGAFVILTIPIFEQLPFWLMGLIKANYNSYSMIIFWQFILAFLVMTIPTTLMGVLFPLGVRIYSQNFSHFGSMIGKAYSINTIGGILGSLIAGFIFVPLIGGQKGIWFSGSIYLLVGGGIFLLSRRGKEAKIVISLFTVLIISIGFVLPSWKSNYLISGPYANWRNFIADSRGQAEKRMESSQILYYKEGVEVNVAVKKSGEQIFLRINGKTDAATGADMDTQILSGQLPMILHKNPKKVLVVGLGSGITLGSVETHQVDKVEAVEIEPAVVQAAKFFKDSNHNALDDPRLIVIEEDGRRYMRLARQKYDVITSEPSNVWLTGNSKLFTKEYFELSRKRLNKGGIFAHWIQLYNLNSEDLKSAIKTFQSVFPNVLVWDNLSSYDLLLVGSEEPFELNPDILEAKLREEKVKKDLGRIFIESPQQLLSYIALDSKGALEFSKGAKENTDNNPYLEFSAPKSLYLATTSKNIESMMELRPPYGSEYFEARKKITLAKMYFTRGEMDKALKAYEEAFKIDSQNGFLKITLGDLYLQKGQRAISSGDARAAEESFLKAEEVNPKDPKIHFYLGALYEIQGKIEEARKQLSLSLELNPNQPEVKNLLNSLSAGRQNL